MPFLVVEVDRKRRRSFRSVVTRAALRENCGEAKIGQRTLRCCMSNDAFAPIPDLTLAA
jgi:hypothetical protein